MIKVCHMTSAHGEEDVRIFHKECVSLAKAGYDTYLVERGESREKNGVHIVGVGDLPQNRRKRMTEGARKVYETARALNADIYHLHDPELLPYGLKLKRAGKKVIFDSHEFTAEAILEKQWLPAVLRGVICTCYQSYEHHVCGKLDGVITVSPHIVGYYKRFNLNTIQVANYPVTSEQSVQPDFSERRIGFAGGITEQWMHEEILKALARLPDCRYILCGPCGEDYLAQLQALPGWKQTDYLGKIPHQQVASQLSKCTAGLALLRSGRNTDWNNGTMGNTKIFEEMMAGLPVVCTNFVLWKEFVDRWHCGICVNPENVDEIAEALRYLLDHPEEARWMGENGRRAVQEEFNWDMEKKKLLELYKIILE